MHRILLYARKSRSLIRFPAGDWLLVPVVFMLLGIARGAVLVLSFKFYCPVMGSKTSLDTSAGALTIRQLNRAARIGRLIRSVAAMTPWQSLCLPQAMVASLLLRIFLIPQVTYFGLTKNTEDTNTDPLLAHAWVMVNDMPVTGGRGHLQYSVVAAFGTGQKEAQQCSLE